MNDLQILYEDNHLLAANKPAGLLTQPSPEEDASLENQAKEYIRVTCDKPGAVWLNAIHRLDRQVSGVVLFARTSKAASRLNAAMRERRVGKIYWAITEALPEQRDRGTLEHHLRHGSHEAQVVSSRDRQGKRALLRYRTLTQHGRFYLLEIELETGRYHQIRAQLAAAGAPVAGDTRYGGDGDPASPRICLHHRRMQVPHPTRDQTIEIGVLPPSESPWRELLPRQS